MTRQDKKTIFSPLPLPLAIALAIQLMALDLHAACIDAVCHKVMRMEKYVHGPIGTGACKTCHKPRVKGLKGPAHRKGQMSVPTRTRKLCLKCHSRLKRALAGKNPHRPVADVDCTFCHDPHSSPNRYLLRTTKKLKKGRSFCFTCHNDRGFKHKLKHKPVAKRKCRGCHQVHGADHPKLLPLPKQRFCLKCHKLKWHQRKVVHGPVAAGLCGACHEPHSAGHPKLLKYPRKSLCLKCHQKKRVEAQHTTTKGYSAKCLECHDAHATNKPHLIRGI